MDPFAQFLNMILHGQGGPQAGMQNAPTPGLHGGLAGVGAQGPNIRGATRGAAPIADAGGPAGGGDAFMTMLQNPQFQEMLKGMAQPQQSQLPGGGVGQMDISRFMQAFAPPTVDASLLRRGQ